jgi:hypothetical protein
MELWTGLLAATSKLGRKGLGALLLLLCTYSRSLALKHCRRNVAFSMKMKLLSTLISCKNEHQVMGP